MEATTPDPRSLGRCFFMYDEISFDEKTVADEVLLFAYPQGPSVIHMETAARTVGSMVQFAQNFSSDRVQIVALQDTKYAVWQEGGLTAILSGERLDSDSCIYSNLHEIIDAISFFNGPIQHIMTSIGKELETLFLKVPRRKQIEELQRRLTATSGLIFKSYQTSSIIDRSFRTIPFISLPREFNRCFIQASRIISKVEENPLNLAACVFYKGHVLCSHFTPEVTRWVLLQSLASRLPEESSDSFGGVSRSDEFSSPQYEFVYVNNKYARYLKDNAVSGDKESGTSQETLPSEVTGLGARGEFKPQSLPSSLSRAQGPAEGYQKRSDRLPGLTDMVNSREFARQGIENSLQSSDAESSNFVSNLSMTIDDSKANFDQKQDGTSNQIPMNMRWTRGSKGQCVALVLVRFKITCIAILVDLCGVADIRHIPRLKLQVEPRLRELQKSIKKWKVWQQTEREKEKEREKEREKDRRQKFQKIGGSKEMGSRGVSQSYAIYKHISRTLECPEADAMSSEPVSYRFLIAVADTHARFRDPASVSQIILQDYSGVIFSRLTHGGEIHYHGRNWQSASMELIEDEAHKNLESVFL